jgi:O-acetyl-ADP-ribose deacetylase (regulator of RNase III)
MRDRRKPVSESAGSSFEVRFGRTHLTAAAGELVDQPVEAIVVSGNQRGMFAAGAAGTLWSAAGEDVERELRTHAPFEIGAAVATGSGRLAERGIRTIAHAIIAPGLGEKPKPRQIPLALARALDLVAERRARSVALPILGISFDADSETRTAAARVVIEALVQHLRTRPNRLERAILVSRFEDDLAPLQAMNTHARDRLWTN